MIEKGQEGEGGRTEEEQSVRVVAVRVVAV